MSTTDSTTLEFWHTKDDAPVLCTRHALEEMNNSLAVVLGMVEPFTSMQNAIDRFSVPPINEPDYFIGETTGTCVACQHEAEHAEVTAAAMGEDVA